MDIKKYNKLIDDLYLLICEYGLQLVGPPNADSPIHDSFQRAVHTGWKKAQLLIREAVEGLDQEIESNKLGQQSARRAKDKERQALALRKGKILEQQRRTIRYAQNAIVWSVFGFKTWIVRRFFLDINIDNVSKHALNHVFEYIDEVNKRDGTLALACDLTTFMHVGDVVQVDLSEESRRVAVIELKEGNKNAKLFELLEELRGVPCPRAVALQVQQLPRKDQDHVLRLLRQQWRLDNAIKAINDGQAKDIRSGKDLRIPDKEYVIESYESRIATLYQKITSGESWAIDVVEDCLFVGLYRPPQMSIAFSPWLEMVEFSGVKVDYAMQVSSPLARPMLTLGWPKDLVLGLLKRDIVLLLALDIPKWMDSANRKWPGFLRFESRSRSKQVSYKKGELMEHDNRLIIGGLSAKQVYVGAGIIGKILFEFLSPVEVFVPWHDDWTEE